MVVSARLANHLVPGIAAPCVGSGASATEAANINHEHQLIRKKFNR